jgi:hypothetical protein
VGNRRAAYEPLLNQSREERYRFGASSPTRVYTQGAPESLISAGDIVALSMTSLRGPSVFDFFVGSVPPEVFVRTAPLSSSSHLPDQPTIPAQTH